MKKLFLFLGLLVTNLSLAYANGYVTDPLTNHYVVYITNNTNSSLRLTALNLGYRFFIDTNRMFAAGTEVDVIGASEQSWVLPRQTKVFALVVKNYKEGYLDIAVDDNGSGFRILQTNNISTTRNCIPTGVLPRFACVYDLPDTTTNKTILLSRPPLVDKYNGVPPTSEVEFYLSVSPKN